MQAGRVCSHTTDQSDAGRAGMFSRRTNRMQAGRVYSHDGPIVCHIQVGRAALAKLHKLAISEADLEAKGERGKGNDRRSEARTSAHAAAETNDDDDDADKCSLSGVSMHSKCNSVQRSLAPTEGSERNVVCATCQRPVPPVCATCQRPVPSSSSGQPPLSAEPSGATEMPGSVPGEGTGTGTKSKASTSH
eukprot:1819397-Pyramimonas_sp.AAC.1